MTRLRISDYSPLIDNIIDKIQAWPRNSLSYAAILELIISVVQGVQCYWMSMLLIPDDVIARIYGLYRNFLWSLKHPSIAWKKLCRPIEGGGLGLRDLRSWNKTSLSKVLWNIHVKKDILWTK